MELPRPGNEAGGTHLRNNGHVRYLRGAPCVRCVHARRGVHTLHVARGALSRSPAVVAARCCHYSSPCSNSPSVENGTVPSGERCAGSLPPRSRTMRRMATRHGTPARPAHHETRVENHYSSPCSNSSSVENGTVPSGERCAGSLPPRSRTMRRIATRHGTPARTAHHETRVEMSCWVPTPTRLRYAHEVQAALQAVPVHEAERRNKRRQQFFLSWHSAVSGRYGGCGYFRPPRAGTPPFKKIINSSSQKLCSGHRANSIYNFTFARSRTPECA